MNIIALLAQTDVATAKTTESIAAAAAEASKFGPWDIALFCIVVVAVIGLGIWKSQDPKSESGEKKEKSASDYFLAGRGLTWWLVGFSLIAANISTEQFVGMSGKAANWLGMAIASYEWMAAITLVGVAFLFLPKLLKARVYTIPEFLEKRYNVASRSVMALATLLILVGVPTAAVIYSGAKVVTVFFAGSLGFGTDPTHDLIVGCLFIALSGAIYVFVGGLKACAWTDLIWGAGLIVGGVIVTYLAMNAIGVADPTTLYQTANAAAPIKDSAELANMGAWERFWALNSGEANVGANTAGGKLTMFRPIEDAEIPWTALCLGLWIPNFFYWGLNQYIMQRTLASKSLAEGQFGIVFAAFLKLIIPFVVVIPGILAYNLYSDQLKHEAIKKNNKAIATLQSEGKLDKTIMFVTDDFILQDSKKAREYTLQNATLLKSDPAQIAELNALFDDIDKQEADSTTSRGVITQDAMKVATIMETQLAAAKAQKLNCSQKLVGYDYDSAFPTLLRNLLTIPGTNWFVLAALFGAVVSSLASMLNSASTVFTMDIYDKLKYGSTAETLAGSEQQQRQNRLVLVGRLGVVLCVILATVIAFQLDNPVFGGIFTFVQEFQGFLSPGALAVFLFGFFVPKCPRIFGWLGFVTATVVYGLLMVIPATASMAFLNRMSVAFIAVVLLGVILTAINTARGGKAIILTSNKDAVNLESSYSAKIFGAIVCVLTVVLYILFR